MVEVRVRGSERRATAIVDDVELAGDNGLEVQAYVVRPLDTGAPRVARPGLVQWHWLDTEAADGNRTQFLHEAGELAVSGVTSILPQGRFPWVISPTAASADAIQLRAEVSRLELCLDALGADPAVDGSRLGIVGHDFGGMLAVIAASARSDIRALVVVAATPRWGDWFLPFWPIVEERIDYLRALRSLDPVERIGETAGTSTLLQYGERDYFIAMMSARELQRAAPEGTGLLTYDSGHDMRLPEIRADRLEFLAQTLGFGAAAELSRDLPDQAATT